jgi:hypothetical protein
MSTPSVVRREEHIAKLLEEIPAELRDAMPETVAWRLIQLAYFRGYQDALTESVTAREEA